MFLFTLSILLNTFSLSISYGRVNRCFMMIANSIIENSVVLVYNPPIYKPFYDKELLESNVKTYLKTEINNLILDSYLGFSYFNPDNNLPCYAKECRGVRVSLRGNIKGIIKYKKILIFTIKEGTK